MYNLTLDIGIEDRTAVLVMTCRKFEQVWMPFFTLFKRFWPDCPYKLIMCSDLGSYDGVESIEVGKDMHWASNCLYALDRIKADRIILFLEDHIPSEAFDNDSIRKFVRLAHDFNIGCLRLLPCPGPDHVWAECDSLGVISQTAPYRLSLQLAIWSKATLKSLLQSGETAWDTEIHGTQRAAKLNDLFLSVWRGQSPTPYIAPAVMKGEWRDDGLALLKREGIPMDDITRKIG